MLEIKGQLGEIEKEKKEKTQKSSEYNNSGSCHILRERQNSISFGRHKTDRCMGKQTDRAAAFRRAGRYIDGRMGGQADRWTYGQTGR